MTAPAAASTHRRLAFGGVVGPVAFVSAWILGGLLDDTDLSPIDDAISQLAAVDSNTRMLMTAGLLTFGFGVGAFAVAAASVLGIRTALALAATAVSTLAVAALPLGSSDAVDSLHGLAAGLGYVTLVLAPIAARKPLRRMGRRRLAAAGVLASTIAAVSLTASLTSAPTGLFQRLGIASIDIWIVAVAVLILRRCTSGTSTPSSDCRIAPSSPPAARLRRSRNCSASDAAVMPAAGGTRIERRRIG